MRSLRRVARTRDPRGRDPLALRASEHNLRARRVPSCPVATRFERKLFREISKFIRNGLPLLLNEYKDLQKFRPLS